jgi:hypothetical protein
MTRVQILASIPRGKNEFYRVSKIEPGSSIFLKNMDPRFGGGCSFGLVPVHKRVTERAVAFILHCVIYSVVSEKVLPSLEI